MLDKADGRAAVAMTAALHPDQVPLDHTPATRLFLSPPEVARLLGCSDVTVRRMIRAGELRAEQRGRNFRVPRAEIDRIAGVQAGPSEADVTRRALVKEARVLVARLTVVLAELEP